MAPKSRVKVGAVSFLNTKPLVYTLENQHEIELSFEVPSRLAEQLRRGEIDVGLIPIIEYFRRAGKFGPYRIIPNISIASRGAVLSIQLFCRVQIPAIRRVALDTNSRTSRALTKIILAEKYNLHPEFVSCPPSVDPRLVDADAVLLIGDAALKRLDSTAISLDLGAEWVDLTGLPFVYACWVARGGVNLQNVPEILLEAKQLGINQIPEIARVEATKLELSEELCRNYLTNHIHYDLGDSEVAGLRRFYEFAVKHKLARIEVPLRFVEG